MRAAPTPNEMLQLDKQLCFAVYSTSLAMTRLYKPLLEKLGLIWNVVHDVPGRKLHEEVSEHA